MSDSFALILRRHTARYPAMQPQDYGKLAYQSEFGPAHMLADAAQAQARLLAEWRAAPTDISPAAPEPIGNGLCRFPFSTAYDAVQAAPLLAQLFARTAARCSGTQAGLELRLAELETLGVAGMEAWIAQYRAAGCPPVSHSAAYRAAYHPHYRLLSTEYASFFPALLLCAQRAAAGRPLLIGIEGRCASGKTALAALMQETFPCRVFHMDDFYLPLAQRAPDWREQCGGNMDFARMRREVLAPVLAGGTVQYRPYRCQQGTYAQPAAILPQPISIIEGSYSAHPALAAPYDVRIFLTCSPKEQLRRLQEREGAYVSAFQETWILMEEHYLHENAPQQNSDVVLDTGALLAGQ